MSDDVLITPASRKVEFFDSGGNIDGKIELSTAGDLNITSTGKITIGDITQDIHIGDGTQAVDLVFDFASSIYSVANQDLTIGKGSLGGNDVIIDGAGAVLLSLAGTEQARLTSTGLGIGTTSPVSALDLSTGALSFANTYTQLKLSGGSNVDLQLGHWGNAHILIDTDGNDGSRYFSVRHGNATAGSATELFKVHENGATTVTGTLDVSGGITGATKEFVIDHPTKPNMKLHHGSLEGPEHGVYHRGRLTDEHEIVLPDYWDGLVDENTITVQLTPYGDYQMLFVESIENNIIRVQNEANEGIDCFFIIHGERKDIGKLEVEY